MTYWYQMTAIYIGSTSLYWYQPNQYLICKWWLEWLMCGCQYQTITAYNGCIFSLDIKIINIYAFANRVHCHTSKDMYLLSQSRLSSNIMIDFYTAEVYLDIKMYIHGYQRYQLISKIVNPWTCMDHAALTGICH